MDRNGSLGIERHCPINRGLLDLLDADNKQINASFPECPYCRKTFCCIGNPEIFQKLLSESDDISISLKKLLKNFRGCVPNPTAFFGKLKRNKHTGELQHSGNGCGGCKGSRKEIPLLTNQKSRFGDVDEEALQLSCTSSGSPSSGSDGEYEPALEEELSVVNKYWRTHHQIKKRDAKVYNPMKDKRRWTKTAYGDYMLAGGSKVKLTVFDGAAAKEDHTQRRKRAANNALESKATRFRPNGAAASTDYDKPEEEGDGKSLALFGGTTVVEQKFSAQAESKLACVLLSEQRDAAHEKRLKDQIHARGEEVPSDDPDSDH